MPATALALARELCNQHLEAEVLGDLAAARACSASRREGVIGRCLLMEEARGRLDVAPAPKLCRTDLNCGDYPARRPIRRGEHLAGGRTSPARAARLLRPVRQRADSLRAVIMLRFSASSRCAQVADAREEQAQAELELFG